MERTFFFFASGYAAFYFDTPLGIYSVSHGIGHWYDERKLRDNKLNRFYD
jgi:hypothetical protein